MGRENKKEIWEEKKEGKVGKKGKVKDIRKQRRTIRRMGMIS